MQFDINQAIVISVVYERCHKRSTVQQQLDLYRRR